MTVVWSPRAIDHLVELRAFVARDNSAAAGPIATAILTAIERLPGLPHLGRPGRVVGTRELLVEGTPYAIPYRLRSDRIEVIAVFHGRQKWPKFL